MKKTSIFMVVDKSGSMQSVRSDVIGSINAFIDEQKAVPGECKMTLAQFDSEDPYCVTYDNKDIQEINHLTPNDYIPRGNTPLLDAIGRGITDLRAKIDAMRWNEKPEAIIFVVQTDGQENASTQYKLQQIKDLINKETNNGWEFVFLGVGPDAMTQSTSMGFSAANSISYAGSAASTQTVIRSTSSNIAQYRSGQASNVSYTTDDRNNAQKE